MALNFQSLKTHGTIEFRQFHAAHHPELIEAWVVIVQHLVHTFSQTSEQPSWFRRYMRLGSELSLEQAQRNMLEDQATASFEEFLADLEMGFRAGDGDSAVRSAVNLLRQMEALRWKIDLPLATMED